MALLDEQRLGSAKLVRDETRISTLPASATEFAAGRHTLSLRFFGAPRATQDAQAELDWVRLGVDDKLPDTYAAPTLRDVVTEVVLDGTPRRSLALRAPSTIRCPLRVASDARLRVALGFWGTGEGLAEVRALREGEPPVSLVQRKVTGGGGATWTEVSLNVGEHASGLVALELRAVASTRGGRVVFGDPVLDRVRPAAATIPEARTAILLVLSSLDRRRVPPWGAVGELGAIGELSRRAAAFSQYRVPSTVPAGVVASLLTGLPPRAHAVEDQAARLPASVRTLPQMVKEASGRAAMFTGVPTTFGAFGFSAGWDRFEQISPVEDMPAAEPILRAARWLQQELRGGDSRRRLVVIHARGAHPPWDLSRDEVAQLKPEEYGGVLDARRGAITLSKLRVRRIRAHRRIESTDWVRLRALEDAALAKQSIAIARLVDSLEQAEAYDDTLLILVGDVASGDPPDLPYDPAGPLEEDRVLVPLLVKFPKGGFAGKEVVTPVTSVDIAATILEALRLKRPEAVQGVDLHGPAAGVEPIVVRPLIATFGGHYASRKGPWLLRGDLGKVPSLCRLDVDPACVTDVFDTQPWAARALWQSTFDAELNAREKRVPREAASIDPDTGAALTVWGDI